MFRLSLNHMLLVEALISVNIFRLSPMLMPVAMWCDLKHSKMKGCLDYLILCTHYYTSKSTLTSMQIMKYLKLLHLHVTTN
jgi:hypothetical protein